MSANPDRLYELLPVVHRMRDAERGYPLRALLQVMAEQASVIEEDIAQLYENWFIETCEDWVVPYIGALIGYLPLQSSGQTGACRSCGGDSSAEPIMIPRREVANTLRYRRRKGTLGILDDLATAVAGWPTRSVEFYRQIAVSQNIGCLHMNRGRTADLRNVDALDELGSPFDRTSRNADIRRVSSPHFPGLGNVGELGTFVWRLKSYPLTRVPAYCYEAEAPNCYLFNPLGHDTPLYVNPSAAVAGDPPDLSVPAPIRRRAFESRDPGTGKQVSGVPFYFGKNRSLMVWIGGAALDAKRIVPADLSGWHYLPTGDEVAIDVERGRLMFPRGYARHESVEVSYAYGFSADMGGGEYSRTIRGPVDATVYRVGVGQDFATIGAALSQWKSDLDGGKEVASAVIEIADSGVYTEPLSIDLKRGQTLQLRAANGSRPVIQLLHWHSSPTNDLVVSGEAESWFILDGIVIYGRGIQVSGDISGVAIRHSTLVPGWGLDCDCNPERPTEASLELLDAPRCLTIEHSIVGAIQIERDQRKQEPLQLRISDSIVDATDPGNVALGASAQLCADANLVLLRSTVIGQVQTRAIVLAENSILMGQVMVCRRQQGCIRFCYVPYGSRTPQRYECQPDLVRQAVSDKFAQGAIDAQLRDALLEGETLRVEPEFNAVRYGNPTYCQLADACATEISAGAEDESEMGAFHDLYQPQRAANLRARLSEYTPAGTDAGIIFVS
jgi:hypothetical protein